MTQAVKDSEGEQSGSFKTMFLMQQSMAFASAIVSAHLAAVQTTADITLPFVGKIPAASAILGFGYANAGIIAAQTLAGMAHDGIDNVPNEGTWLLDKGERVVDSRTNADLKNYLSNRSAKDRVNININVPPGYTAQQTQDNNGITIDIVKQIVDEKFQNVRRANSQESRIFQETYGLSPSR